MVRSVCELLQRLLSARLTGPLVLGAVLMLLHSPAFAQQCQVGPSNCDTRGGGWSDAQFPHAIVNGCDYVGGVFRSDLRHFLNGVGVPDLTGACEAHDRCYYSNNGESAAKCNALFLDRLVKICRNKHCIAGTVCNAPLLSQCLSTVKAMAAVVHAAAPLALTRARSTQRDYMTYIRDNCEYRTWERHPCPSPEPSCRTANGVLSCPECEASCTEGQSIWIFREVGR